MPPWRRRLTRLIDDLKALAIAALILRLGFPVHLAIRG